MIWWLSVPLIWWSDDWVCPAADLAASSLVGQWNDRNCGHSEENWQHKYTNTKIQKYKNAQLHKYKNTKMQKLSTHKRKYKLNTLAINMSSMSFLWERGVFLRTCMLSEVWEKFNCKFGLTCKFADPRIDWDRNFNFWISHHCDLESGFLISKEELLCQSKVSAPQKVLLGGKCIKIFRKIEIYPCNALFTPAKLQKRWNLPFQVPFWG